MNTPHTLRVDFVSDIVCPWCAVGLHSLLAAAERVPEVQLDLHFHPFELNPQMGPEGEDLREHLQRKYGGGPAQFDQVHEMLRQRGAALGFAFSPARTRIVNTRDAHRLLHWAGLKEDGSQQRLKTALLHAYFSEGRDVSSRSVLLEVATACGLDAAATAEVLESGQFGDEVAAAERQIQAQGINSVPAIVFEQQHLVQGGQPVETFEQVLRQLAARPS
jgi:predicted DsbA family dithiol-disulfide isomerase